MNQEHVSVPSGPSAEDPRIEQMAAVIFAHITNLCMSAEGRANKAECRDAAIEILALGASASAAGHREERERLAVVCERLAMWHLEKYGRDPEVADLRSIAARLRQPIGPAWDDGTASAEPPPEPIR